MKLIAKNGSMLSCGWLPPTGGAIELGFIVASEAWSVYGVLAVTIFCAVVTWIILKIVDALVGLRVSRDEETEGLDTALHGERVQ